MRWRCFFGGGVRSRNSSGVRTSSVFPLGPGLLQDNRSLAKMGLAQWVQPILRARFRHQAERKPKVNSPKTFYIKVSTRYLNKRSLPNTYPVSGLERTALSTSESAPAFFDQQTDSAPVQKHQINAVCAQLIFLGLFWAPVICS